MTWKWRKKLSSLVLGSVLMGLLPVCGVSAVTLPPTDEGISTTNWSTLGESIRPLSDVAATTIASTESTQSSAIEDEQRVIITFKDKKKVAKSLIKGKVKRQHKYSPSISAKMTSKEIENLKKNTDVQSVEPDIQLQTASQTMDWGVSVGNATYAWNNGFTGKGVKVAVLDSGIDTHHEDLVVAGGASFVDYTTSYDDDFGHGTHVAGIIGAKNNDVGVVGVAPDADLYAVKVLDSTGKGYLSDVIAAIDWAVDNHMDILNMSMATSVDSPAFHSAVDQAYESGLLLVAAAGNTGNAEGTGNTIQYPAKYSSVISVGAVDQNNQRATFSATGSELEVVAPGVGIQSTYLNNGYSTQSGTSTAASFVSGELALLKQARPSDKNGEFRMKLKKEMSPIKTPSDVTVSQEVYQNDLIHSSSLGNSIKRTLNGQVTPEDDTYLWPSLINAKSISYNLGVRYVLYNDGTLKRTLEGQGALGDDTYLWPSLINAKSISYERGLRYVLYNDGTIKRTLEGQGALGDDTNLWPSLINARSISYNSGNRFVLYNDGTIKGAYGGYALQDDTNLWPSLINAKSISVDRGLRYVGYFDQNPTISNLLNNNQVVYKGGSGNIITLTGNVSDPDNDNVTISATIAGITKSTTISNTLTSKSWTLQWNVDSDNLAAGSYSNVTVVANDNLWGTASSTYTGTIVIDIIPNQPSALLPGSLSIDASLVAVAVTTLNWTFTDVDAGDTQSAYDVQIYKATGLTDWFYSELTQVHDSGWVYSGASSYTIPYGKLSRGTTYRWRVAVKDSKGGVSAFTPFYYIKTNNLPTLSITSYTDGQALSSNVLNFTWTYADADGQTQNSYRIRGSKDNWTTIAYDSEARTGTTTSFQTPVLTEGTWSFEITVNDGLEWSDPAARSALTISKTPVETQAPTAPTKLLITSKTANSVSLSWTASIDNVGVTAYIVYNGSTQIGSTNNINYTAQNLAANTLYALKVTAIDAAGNESQASNTLYFYTGIYEYHYDVTGRIDYLLFSSGQKLKYKYDANGNLFNIQIQK
ncbi:S8 family serine peptidase [Paenibacillus sp. SI8]|uniref:S8 family serine peptidase n=1 Tax=unclassified Paenibacillus TaxID=185978 RepID=UPI0034669771